MDKSPEALLTYLAAQAKLQTDAPSYTLSDVATILRCHRATVWTLVHTGRLPTIGTTPRRRLCLRPALVAYLASLNPSASVA